MALIDKLEAKFGHLAVPHIVKILALFQVAVFAMLWMQPAFVSWITLHPEEVMRGQVWRLITWVFIPAINLSDQLAVIWIIFAVMIMFMMGDALESVWGAFRLNLYIIGGILAVIIGAMIFDFTPQGVTLYSTIFLAFAVFFPDVEFLVFFILPVKVKYLAWINGALFLLALIDSPSARLPILFGLANFIIAFGPGFIRGAKQGAVVAQRRNRFTAARTSESVAFHQCATCKKTELDDKNLDFRVTADGEEYCTVCRPRANA
jgi:hypothetical protein